MKLFVIEYSNLDFKSCLLSYPHTHTPPAQTPNYIMNQSAHKWVVEQKTWGKKVQKYTMFLIRIYLVFFINRK